jgi:hypothetical protein
MPRVIVFPWPEPAPDAAGAAEVPAEPDELAPAAAVVLDELQAVATPDRRVAAAAAASNLLLVFISIENLPLGYIAVTNYWSS